MTRTETAALDWQLRAWAPAWLELAGLDEQAAELRNLPPASALTAEDALHAAYRAACSAADAWADAKHAAGARSAEMDLVSRGTGSTALDAALCAALDAAGDAVAGAPLKAAREAAMSEARGSRAADAALAHAMAAALDAALCAALGAAMRAAGEVGTVRACATAARDALAPAVARLRDSAAALPRAH